MMKSMPAEAIPVEEKKTQRLGFLRTLKEIFLKMHDRLSAYTDVPEIEEQPVQLASFLNMRPQMGWVQYILPPELTFSPLMFVTLHDNPGHFGEIAEIFQFGVYLEGFIVFHGNPFIPNIDVVMLPEHNLIQIKDPHHTATPLQFSRASHWPTRRPAIGTLVSLSEMGSTGLIEATVVAIEQNTWPKG